MSWEKTPNRLTIGRMFLAAIFFVLVGTFDSDRTHAVTYQWLLNIAFAIYVVAGITDVLDGWLARKYNWTSAFGRIVDPFVDKVLVLGAFAMLAGSNFTFSPGTSDFERSLPYWITGHSLTGVQAWMVVVIMGREFIISAIRGYSESQGLKFPATQAGKIKMLVQSVAICVTLFQIANLPDVPWAIAFRLLLVWLAVFVTVLSGFAYVKRSRKLILQNA
ncbi:MAG: CDP-alcohol phosphatidyltransferase family protein [Phycisphaerae bacterium]